MSEIKTVAGTITVSGPVGIGKSLVLTTIIEALKKELGIDINVDNVSANKLPERIYQWEIDMARNTQWSVEEICTPSPTKTLTLTKTGVEGVYTVGNRVCKLFLKGEAHELSAFKESHMVLRVALNDLHYELVSVYQSDEVMDIRVVAQDTDSGHWHAVGETLTEFVIPVNHPATRMLVW